MQCQGKKICTTIEVLLGHGSIKIERDKAMFRVEWTTGVDERWIGTGPSVYAAMDHAVNKWADDSRVVGS